MKVNPHFLTDTCDVLRPMLDQFNNSYGDLQTVATAVSCSGIWPHDADYDTEEIPRTFRATELMYLDGSTFPDGAEPMIGDFIRPGSGIERVIERVNNWNQGAGDIYELRVTRNADASRGRGTTPLDLL